MSEIKESTVRNEHGEEIGRNYTEERRDGNIETRHYSSHGLDYLGRTVSDPDTGKSDHYSSGGDHDGGDSGK